MYNITVLEICKKTMDDLLNGVWEILIGQILDMVDLVWYLDKR